MPFQANGLVAGEMEGQIVPERQGLIAGFRFVEPNAGRSRKEEQLRAHGDGVPDAHQAFTARLARDQCRIARAQVLDAHAAAVGKDAAVASRGEPIVEAHDARGVAPQRDTVRANRPHAAAQRPFYGHQLCLHAAHPSIIPR